MPNNNLHAQLAPLYSLYNNVAKYLIADIEARTEKFPQQVFNEIRAFNDHIARCYTFDATAETIQTEVRKAASHMERIIFDCYKMLNIYFFDFVRVFEKRVKNVDFTIINDGKFYTEFNELRKTIVSKKNEAKLNEGLDKKKSINLYQEAYNNGVKISDLIIDNEVHIQRCIKKYRRNKIWNICKWVIGLIVGAVIGAIISPVVQKFIS